MNSASSVLAHGAFWLVWAGLLVLAIIALEELVVDLGRHYLARAGRGANKLRAPLPSIDRDDLPVASRKSLAVMMPAWIEADVLVQAVTALLDSADVDRSQIFIACWSNDPATCDEAQMLASRYLNVHMVELPTDGPGPTAEAVNFLFGRACDFEIETGLEFDGFVVVHPGESLHPRTFDLVQWGLDRSDVVRLPILASPGAGDSSLLQGHIGDMLSEQHLRMLPVRAGLCSLVSGGGCLLAFSRNAARDVRSATRSGDLLSRSSYAPDYELELRLAATNLDRVYGRLVALRQEIGPLYARTISVRRRFPKDLKGALRYRARRIAGLTRHALPALAKSPKTDFWFRFGLWQDARVIPFAHLVFAASVSAGALTVAQLLADKSLTGWWVSFIETTPAVPVLAGLAGFGVFSRLLQRHVSSVRVYGPGRLFMVLPCFVVGLMFEYLAICRATLSVLPLGFGFIRRVGNTRQIDPLTFRRLRRPASGERSPLGELLVSRGELGFKELSEALQEQRTARRPLGRILVDRGETDERVILNALSDQLHLKVIDFDAAELPARIGLLLPFSLMFEHRLFPVALSDEGEISIACYRQLDQQTIHSIREQLAMPVQICLSRRGDVRQALRMFRILSEVVDDRFLAASNETLGELTSRLRRGTRRRNSQRKPVSERGLGDYLVAEGFLDRETMTLCVQSAASRALSLGDYLVNQGFLTHQAIDEVIDRMRRVRGIRLVSVGGQQLADIDLLSDVHSIDGDGRDSSRGTP